MRRTIIFVVLAAILVGGAIYLTRSGQSANIMTASNSSSTDTVNNNSIQSAMNDLKIEDLKVGTGTETKDGDHVTVNYVGTLDNGTKFDSSYDRGTPFSFDLGAGKVIPGWDLGVKGMKIGGKRRLIIPAALGYGANGAGSLIPPNSTLHFDIELLKIGK
jgi:FKBP-type peptidyl-prolyl cis-trans isomerase